MQQIGYEYNKRIQNKEQLDAVRKVVNSSSDEEIAEELNERWMSDERFEESLPSDIDERMMKMKERIMRRLEPKKKRRTLLYAMSVMRYAAIFLLPLLLATTLYLYKENRRMGDDGVAVQTSKGESATITLPDGTLVKMNFDTKLVYSAKDYNKSERRVDFEGEGWFEVAKNPDRPFYVNSQKLEVKVLGTKFNLMARPNRTSATLFLQEGKVQFTSCLTHEKTILNPGDKAVLDYQTGKISVTRSVEGSDEMAWRNKEIIFKDVPLAKVLDELHDIYGVSVLVYDMSACPSFTGTLPMHDLKEALQILSTSYNMKSKIKGHTVVLKK